jgi:hypothetical protein
LRYKNTILWCSRCSIHRYVPAPAFEQSVLSALRISLRIR